MTEEEENQATGLLDNLVSSVQESKQAENAGWIGGLIVAILAIVVIAALAFRAWQKGKEMAKLQHEKAVREEEAHQATIDAELATIEEARSSALQKAHTLRERAVELGQRLEDVRRGRNEALQAIDRITSWDDVDTYRNSN